MQQTTLPIRAGLWRIQSTFYVKWVLQKGKKLQCNVSKYKKLTQHDQKKHREQLHATSRFKPYDPRWCRHQSPRVLHRALPTPKVGSEIWWLVEAVLVLHEFVLVFCQARKTCYFCSRFLFLQCYFIWGLALQKDKKVIQRGNWTPPKFQYQ